MMELSLVRSPIDTLDDSVVVSRSSKQQSGHTSGDIISLVEISETAAIVVVNAEAELVEHPHHEHNLSISDGSGVGVALVGDDRLHQTMQQLPPTMRREHRTLVSVDSVG